MERWIWGDILVDKLWGEGDSGSWLQESDTAVEYKSELLEVCSCEGHPCLKSDQMAKQDRILDGTLWPQDRWHYRENGGAWAAEFLIIRTGKLAAACECGSMVSAQFAITCEPWQDRGTNLCEGDVQRTETQWPYSFPWEGQCRCAHNQVTSLHVGALQVAGPLWPTSPLGISEWFALQESAEFGTHKMKMAIPWGFIEEMGPLSFSSRSGDQAPLF